MRNRLTTLPLFMLALSCGTRGYVLRERMTASRVELTEAGPAWITISVPAGFDYLSLVEDSPRFGVSELEIRCPEHDSARIAGRLERVRTETPWMISIQPDTAGSEVLLLQKGLSWKPSVSALCSGDACTITLSASIENLTRRNWLFDTLILRYRDGERAASTGAGSLPQGRHSYPFWTGTGCMLDPILVYDVFEPGRWSLAYPVLFVDEPLPQIRGSGCGPVLAISGDTLWLRPDDLCLREVACTAGRDRYEYTLTVASRRSSSVTLALPEAVQIPSGAVLEITSPPGGFTCIPPSGTVSITATRTYPRARSYYP
ncbi:hypothetical protein GX411_05835 [Candidatus Fermentibacteria bacterium]|nr:hypothetical protein [Candidatus Fermentibacteria bacterium]